MKSSVPTSGVHDLIRLKISEVNSLRAYLLLKTRDTTATDIVNTIRRHYEQSYVMGETVYGWYDAFIELEVADLAKVTQIVDKLKQTQSNLTHIETVIEKPHDQTLYCSQK